MNDAVDAADRANLAIYTIYFKGEGRNEGFGFPGGGGHHGGRYPGGGGGGYPGGGGGYPGGGGGSYPGGGGGVAAAISMRVSTDKMLQIATRTGGHAYEAKKKEIYADLQPDCRGTARAVPADLHAGRGRQGRRVPQDRIEGVQVILRRECGEGYYACGEGQKSVIRCWNLEILQGLGCSLTQEKCC